MDRATRACIFEARKNGKPVQTVDPDEIRLENIDRLIERREQAEERKRFAKYVYPIELKLNDAIRERDYYRGLILENKYIENALKDIEKSRGLLDQEKDEYEKRILSISRTNQSLQDEIYKLKDKILHLGFRLKDTKKPKEIYRTTVDRISTQECILNGEINILKTKNHDLTTRLNEVIDAYDKLALLVRSKFQTKQKTDDEKREACDNESEQ